MPNDETYDAVLAAAKAKFAGDDTTVVDDDARVSFGEEGVWVQTWSFIPLDEIPLPEEV